MDNLISFNNEVTEIKRVISRKGSLNYRVSYIRGVSQMLERAYAEGNIDTNCLILKENVTYWVDEHCRGNLDGKSSKWSQQRGKQRLMRKILDEVANYEVRKQDIERHRKDNESEGITVQVNTTSSADVEELKAQLAALQAQVETMGMRKPRSIVITAPDGSENKVDGAHHMMEKVLRAIQAGFKNIMLVGPAGTGKTTLAKQVAGALGRDFGFLSLSGGITESHLLGRCVPSLKDGTPKFYPAEFVRMYETGGVFLLDEVDGADANVMVACNAALANGMLKNPISDTTHERHEDTVLICAANTFGRGASAQYVGRNPLDAATLDRFIGSTFEVGYDVSIEESIASQAGDIGISFMRWVQSVRYEVETCRMRRVIGTRMIEAGVKWLNVGESLSDVKEKMLVGWSEDEKRKIEHV